MSKDLFHPGGRLLLHAVQNMAVHVESESDRGVAEAFGNDLDIQAQRRSTANR